MLFKPNEVTTGRFPCRIVRRLLGAAMAELYQAQLQNTQHSVVIKAVSAKQAQVRQQALEQEAKLLAGLYHQHIPQILEYVREEERQYYVMTYHEGLNLKQYYSRYKEMCEEDILHVLYDTANTLHYLHQKGIYHGDIKPSNILLEPSKDAVLLDFGTAGVLGEPRKDIRFLGTIGYAAPECCQCGTEQITAAADIFSLGATLYYLLEGKEPGCGRLTLSDMQKKKRWQPILDRCCTFDRQQRFQSAAELTAFISGGNTAIHTWHWNKADLLKDL